MPDKLSAEDHAFIDVVLPDKLSAWDHSLTPVCLFQPPEDASSKADNLKPPTPVGANHPNLFVAVPKLPLPEKLKKFLLFDVNIYEQPPPAIPRDVKESAAMQGINWWDPDMDPPGKHYRYDW